MPPNVRYVGHVYTADHNAMNCSATAVLNINRESMARYGASPPTRIFEAAGAGACVISDCWEGIEKFLEPETDILLAGDGAEVVDRLSALSPEQARRIGENARRRVCAEHTYAHRAAEVEALLDGRAFWRRAS
jgi:spore maturation protein CgeB